jgi:predicted oxidoreductase
MNLGGAWDKKPISADDRKKAAAAIEATLDQGITLFDHADIYTYGKSEEVFGEILKQRPGLRDKIVIQTKCGIRFQDEPRKNDPTRYDFSYQHITSSVEASLRRLQTDHVDVLLLHRPDALVEPQEVAQAFRDLQKSGKVLHFGVSNHTALQIALLQKHADQPLIINQIEINLLHAESINAGIVANQNSGMYTAADGILDYCRLHDIMVQAWSPLAGGAFFKPSAKASGSVRKVKKLVASLARVKETGPEAILIAWLLRHPAPILPVIGTINPARIKACCRADSVQLSREEWYSLFTAARGAEVP